MGYVCKIPKPEGGYSACSQILWNDSTGCDEVDGYYVTEADTMIGIVYDDDLGESLIFTFNRNIHQSILFKCNSYTIILCLCLYML